MFEVTAAIIKQNDKYLICQRESDDEYNLLWEFPGGKLEMGETLEHCIIREINEEKEIHFTFFRCNILRGEIELNAHNDVKWVTLEDMKNYNFMPADVQIVEKLK